jgi:hypothetical protein
MHPRLTAVMAQMRTEELLCAAQNARRATDARRHTRSRGRLPSEPRVVSGGHGLIASVRHAFSGIHNHPHSEQPCTPT